MQIAIFSINKCTTESTAETAILFTLTGYVRDPEAENIDSIAGKFSQNTICLKIFYKIEMGESIYFHKCKDSLVNRYGLTVDQCKTQIGYSVSYV